MSDQKEMIFKNEDVLTMLDALLREPAPFWNNFYSDREKKVPFFINVPDENLVQYFEQDVLRPSEVLELGCGPGRNAIYMTEQGAKVKAVDLSKEALEWATERTQKRGLDIQFHCENIFDLEIEADSYDMVYDSGCFHHIPPHRRMDYVALVKKALKPDGYFGLTCFIPGGSHGGSDITDWEVYRGRSLHGGLGYTEEKLKTIFKDFKVVEMRRMRDIEESIPMFGISGLRAALFQKF